MSSSTESPQSQEVAASSLKDRYFGRTSIVHLVSSYFHSGPRHKPALSSDDFRRCGMQMINYIADYHHNLEKRRVVPDVEPGYLAKLLPEEAPEDGESFETILSDVERCIMPGITHWQHPRFHAYFPSGNSYPSILADMLSDAIGCIGFSWTSASEAVLVALLAARHHKIKELKERYPFVEDGVLLSKLVAYSSKEAHSCVEKAAMLGFVKLRILETDDKYSLRGETLLSTIWEDTYAGLVPFFVVATLGTTSCCSFDNLAEIGEACSQENLWLHVDAAYAGSAFICEEFRGHLEGVQHWSIPLSRRFRALKLWFVIRMYGIKGLQSYVREAPCEVNKRLLTTLNASGKIHMVPASLSGKFTIRFCICAETARDRDVVVAWEIIQDCAVSVLGLHNFVTWTVRVANGPTMVNFERAAEEPDDEDEMEDIVPETPELKRTSMKKRATAALRRSYFVRMVSDPKTYNPKIARNLSIGKRLSAIKSQRP